MTRELRRLWAAPFTWLLVLGPTAMSGVLALFQRRYGPEAYWNLMGQFWDKLGLAAVTALVLTTCLSLMSCDRACRTEDLMLTTRLGRKTLFLRRLLACALGQISCGGWHCPRDFPSRRAGQPPTWATPCWLRQVEHSWLWPPAGCVRPSVPCLSPFS